MDNNDQTVTKLDRNWSKWQVSPQWTILPYNVTSVCIARSSLFWFGIPKKKSW